MRNAWIVAQRELGAIFAQPIAYIFTIVLLGITGLVFAFYLASYSNPFGGAPEPDVSGVLNFFIFVTLLALPAVTMRLLSEEQRSGTMELLMTMPVRDGEVVLGKFIASFLFYLMTVALTLLFPFILLRFGNPDPGPIITGYVGVILWGAALLGIGILASSLTENQIVAYILALGINLALWLSFVVSNSILTNIPWVTTNAPWISTFFDEISLFAHQDNFARGLIVATDVAYYLIITAIALFAAARILESRRWW
jgi:ABC-2 type transport system permease protein